MVNSLKTLSVAALAIAATGCLQIETSHTLYLSPDGAVAWMAEEKGVYSDETDACKRLAEEDAYLAEVKGGTNKLALGLTALGPERPVRTHVLRDERPFHAITEARFDSVERALQRLFYESGLDAKVTLDRDGDQVTLRVALDFSREPVEQKSPAGALLEDFDKYRFVLTDGEFVSGNGFDIDRATATLSKAWGEQAEQAGANGGTIELVLTWRG